MEGYFAIYLNGQSVGKVQVSREGLYYRFSARCQLTGDSVCRLMANDVSLCILVPLGDGFGLDTKQSAKRFSGDWDFQISPNRPVLEGRFVPIKPEEPFSYIERLKTAYLVKRDKQVGILLNE